MELLERDDVLRELDATLKVAAAGNGRVALVSGEAGIGKTSLVERFVQIHQGAVRVWWGACDSLFTPRPLGPLFDMALQVKSDLLSLHNLNTDRSSLFAAFLQELQRARTLVVFEDVHWADEATLDLIKFIGRRIQRTSALLILTYRDDEIGPRHPLQITLGDLATSTATRRLTLAPLSEAAVRALAANRPFDPVALHRQTSGNPFFVTEVLASGASGIPATIRDAVLARAARLSPSGRAVLEAAAAIGSRVEPWVLAEVIGAEVEAADECIAVGMLRSQGNLLTFRHELARQTIIEALSPSHKLALHRLTLAALRSLPATRNDLARLAHHAEAANNREAVLEYAPAAAKQAAASAHREAAALYALALRFADDLPPDEQALLLEAYAQECDITDRRPEGIAARRKALELWRVAGNALKQGENLARLMGPYLSAGQNAEAERVSHTAIEVLETLPPSRELALAYQAQSGLRMLNRDYAEAIDWGERAIALAERFEDAEILALAHNSVGAAWLFLDYARGCAHLERSLVIAREAGLDTYVGNAFSNLGSGSGELYQLQRADRYLAEGIAYSTERDLDSMRLYMLAWQALTHLYLGRWSKAAEAATAVLQHPGVSAISRIMALVALGRLRTRRGDPSASNALDEALELAEQTETLQRIAPVRAARAESDWLAGDHQRALSEAQAAYDLAVSKSHPWFTGELGFWRWRAGAEVSLPAWAAKPFALQLEGDWRAAGEAWQQLGCPYERAMALMDGDEAAQLLALEIFDQLGARPAAALARQKLRDVPQRQLAKGKFGGLTEREREVARLIVQGKSNREIAEAMTVGVKTIETYVTRILNKLGFVSRVQIATWAVEKGLAQPLHPSES